MGLNSELTNDFRVLSIQSHVVFGYVGNKSAVFPLQVLGFEVDPINSVQFSTHTGYPYWSGQVLQEKDLFDLFDGLKRNHLHKRYTHILTGYAKSVSFLDEVYKLIKEVKTVSPNAFYVCDPVMGDNGKMYVPEELLPVYRDKITLIADIITPNQFETELLTGIKIKTESDALKAIDILHDRGIPTVVISSTDLGNESLLIALASTKINGTKQAVRLEIPKLPVSFIGTGDLFASLFLAWFTKTGRDVKITFEKTVATLQDILNRTYEYALKQDGACNTPANYELRLIQSIRDIENPKSTIKATFIQNN